METWRIGKLNTKRVDRKVDFFKISHESPEKIS